MVCKLSVDVNIDVKNGAILLDGMMKDIVTESESFQVDSFIPLLRKYIMYARQTVRPALQAIDEEKIKGVYAELRRREGTSGIAEKAARPKS